MHTTTLLAHYGLTPQPRPIARRRPAAAPRRRPLRGTPRPGAEVRAPRRRLAMRDRLRPAATRWRVAAIAGLLALVIGGLGVLRVWPPFAVVMSGSMAPTINTGDMVVLERLRAPARIGQVVAVDVPDATRARYGYPPVVIHRVFKITPDGQIRTKGDARRQPDPFTVPRSAVDTTVIARIPSGGRVLAFFHSAPGLLWLAFGGFLFFGLPVLEHQRDTRRREAETTADLHDELAAVTGELARLRAEQASSREAADATLSQLDRLTQLVERAQPSQHALSGPAEIAAVAAALPATTAVAAPEPGDEIAPAAPAPSPAGASATAEVGRTAGDDATPTLRLLPVARGDDAVAAPDPAPVTSAAPPTDAAAVVAESPVLADSPAVVDSPAAGRPPLVAHAPAGGRPRVGPAASAVPGVAAPIIPGAVFVLTAVHAPRTPAPIGRWDEPPRLPEARATGWTAAPAGAPTRRFSRDGRLVAASRA